MLQLCIETDGNVWANQVLDMCVERFNRCADPHKVQAILLTGSFSRGEASIFKENDSYSLCGDIEFLLIGTNKKNIHVLARQFDEVAKKISSEACKQFNTSIEVDIGIVGPDYFDTKMKPSIFAYDLTQHAKIIYGDKDIIKKNYLFDADKIPKEDALALVMNRTVELLNLTNSKPKLTKIAYHLIKVLLDMAGSLLAFIGNYVAPYRLRAQSIREQFNYVNWPIPNIVFDEFADSISYASQLKTSQSHPTGWENDILKSQHRIEKWLAELIIWEMESLLSSHGVSIEILFDRFKSRESLLQLIKGWAKYLFHPTGSPDLLMLIKAIIHFSRSSPKTLIYSSALMCFLGNVYENPLLTEKAERDLLFFKRENNMSCTTNACALWDRFIRHN